MGINFAFYRVAVSSTIDDNTGYYFSLKYIGNNYNLADLKEVLNWNPPAERFVSCVDELYIEEQGKTTGVGHAMARGPVKNKTKFYEFW